MKLTVFILALAIARGVDGSSCSPECGAGEVCGNQYGTGSACVNAGTICGDHQFAEDGKCKTCPAGQESLDDTAPCETCPDGAVRGNRYGTGGGGCISPDGICGNQEYAQDGKCKTCPAGQVSYDSLLPCTTCPDGTVRGNRYGTGTGGCVPASIECGPHEYGEDGKCKTCGAGMANVGFCELCPPGWVRGNRYGTGSSGCVPGFTVCDDHEYAEDGKCKTCPAGRVALPDRTDCDVPCAEGLVRGNRYGTGSGSCIDADGICGDHEYAQDGKCKTCPAGKESLNHIWPCVTCDVGEVRGNRYGTGSGPCIAAGAICGDHEYAEDGKCKTCSAGYVSLDDTAPCEVCSDGTVRGNRYGTGSGGCIDDGSVCNSSEVGSGGKCVTAS